MKTSKTPKQERRVVKPIQYYPSAEEMEAIDALAFKHMAVTGSGQVGRTSVTRDLIRAALRDRLLLLRTYPELKENVPDPVDKLLKG